MDEALVRRLLQDQHPDLADRSLAPLASGWDNALLRLGPDLIVRLPRRELAAHLVEHELRWLPRLAPRLPLPIPVPVRTGVPGPGYPWAWSIVPYFPGAPALIDRPREGLAAAQALGAFVAALHQPAPSDAPVNPFRGIPLADRSDRTLTWVDQLADTIDAPAVARCWLDHVAVPRWTGPTVWLHGDLHPNNVVVHQGEVSAVIDFGDLCSGDPATDLAIAWMLLPREARPRFRAAAGDVSDVDDDTWRRGRGWALSLGLAYLAHSAGGPAYEQVGRATIEAVLSDSDVD